MTSDDALCEKGRQNRIQRQILPQESRFFLRKIDFENFFDFLPQILVETFGRGPLSHSYKEGISLLRISTLENIKIV